MLTPSFAGLGMFCWLSQLPMALNEKPVKSDRLCCVKPIRVRAFLSLSDKI
jgi:hypothetical protein